MQSWAVIALNCQKMKHHCVLWSWTKQEGCELWLSCNGNTKMHINDIQLGALFKITCKIDIRPAVFEVDIAKQNLLFLYCSRVVFQTLSEMQIFQKNGGWLSGGSCCLLPPAKAPCTCDTFLVPAPGCSWNWPAANTCYIQSKTPGCWYWHEVVVNRPHDLQRTPVILKYSHFLNWKSVAALALELCRWR